MRSRSRVVACAAVLLLSCGDLPPPEIAAIEPSEGPTDRATPIVIHGRHLDRVIEEEGSALVARPWTGNVGGLALEQVTWRSPERIDAVVPAGLATGAHDVVLRVDGRPEARAPGAFTASSP